LIRHHPSGEFNLIQITSKGKKVFAKRAQEKRAEQEAALKRSGEEIKKKWAEKKKEAQKKELTPKQIQAQKVKDTIARRQAQAPKDNNPVTPETRKRAINAVYKKFRLWGDGMIQNKKHKVASPAEHYSSYTLEDMSNSELTALAERHKIKLPEPKQPKMKDALPPGFEGFDDAEIGKTTATPSEIKAFRDLKSGDQIRVGNLKFDITKDYGTYTKVANIVGSKGRKYWILEIHPETHKVSAYQGIDGTMDHGPDPRVTGKMKKIEMGDKTISSGVKKNPDGTYTAMTYTQSKDFKTEKGAQKWHDKMTGKSLEPKAKLAKVESAHDIKKQLKERFGHHPGFEVAVQNSLGSTPDKPMKTMTVAYSTVGVPKDGKRTLEYYNSKHNTMYHIDGFDGEGKGAKVRVEQFHTPLDRESPKMRKKTGTMDAVMKHLSKHLDDHTAYATSKTKKAEDNDMSGINRLGNLLHKSNPDKSQEQAVESTVSKAEESNMSNVEQLSKGMQAFYDKDAQLIPESYLMDLVNAFIEEAAEHEMKELNMQEMNLEGQNRYAQLCTGVYNELVSCAQVNPNLRRALEQYAGMLNEGYVKQYLTEQGLLHTRNENYIADKMSQVGGYHPTKMAFSECAADSAPSTLQKADDGMVRLPDSDENPMDGLGQYHKGLSKALGHEHLRDERVVPAVSDDNPYIVDPHKA
jgi:hypothetical protein